MHEYGDTLAVFGVLVLVLVVFFLLLCAVEVIILWKLFTKAGKPGWAALIPFYNGIVMLDIVGFKWYYIFLFIVPGLLSSIPFIGWLLALVMYAFYVVLSIKMAKSYGQSVGFGVGIILLNIIFLGIIAFNKDIKYVGPTVKGDIDFNDLFW